MTWRGPIKKIDNCRFEISQDYQNEAMKRLGLTMNVPGLIYTNEKMLAAIVRDDSPEQVVNVATLPGIVGYSMAMPDIHHGYGFAIGGVAAFDAEEGVISPGGVGYDINCGVRLLRTDLSADEIRPRIRDLIETMFTNIPSGVGSKSKLRLTQGQIDQVLDTGARWAVEQGLGWAEDLDRKSVV